MISKICKRCNELITEEQLKKITLKKSAWNGVTQHFECRLLSKKDRQREKSFKNRKYKKCKECSEQNLTSRQFCSDFCKKNYQSKKSKKRSVNKKPFRKLINGIPRFKEIEYYNILLKKVSSFKEVYETDTLPHKRTRGWILKYCGRPEWYSNKEETLQKSKIKSFERVQRSCKELENFPHIKRATVISGAKIEVECYNGHIYSGEYYRFKETKFCSSCQREEKKLSRKQLRIEETKKRKQAKESERVRYVNKSLSLLKSFVKKESYKEFSSWKETPVRKEYNLLTYHKHKQYLPKDLRLELDKINYFFFKSTNSICPYPTLPNHKWCRECEVQRPLEDFRNKNICKPCTKEKRKLVYNPAQNLKWRQKYKTDPVTKLHSIIGAYLSKVINGKFKTKRTLRSVEILGIDWVQFRYYIESHFEDWMNWDNHGHGKGKWNLQHIIPKSLAKTEEDVYRLTYYRNFIPMDFVKNVSLSDRILRTQLNEWHYKECNDFLERHKELIIEDGENPFMIKNYRINK